MNTLKKYLKNYIPQLVVIGFLLAVLVGSSPFGAFGAISNDAPTVTGGTFRTYEFFASTTEPTTVATTTSATSTNIIAFTDTSGRVDNGYFVVAGAKKVTLFFSRGDTTGQGNSGSSDFRIQVSDDGSNWYNYNGLATSSIATLVRTASTTISAATSTSIYSMDIAHGAFYAIRCIVVEVTDGEHRCRALAEF